MNMVINQRASEAQHRRRAREREHSLIVMRLQGLAYATLNKDMTLEDIFNRIVLIINNQLRLDTIGTFKGLLGDIDLDKSFTPEDLSRAAYEIFLRCVLDHSPDFIKVDKDTYRVKIGNER